MLQQEKLGSGLALLVTAHQVNVKSQIAMPQVVLALFILPVLIEQPAQLMRKILFFQILAYQQLKNCTSYYITIKHYLKKIL